MPMPTVTIHTTHTTRLHSGGIARIVVESSCILGIFLTAQQQAVGDETVAPTVAALLTGCEHFFETWESAGATVTTQLQTLDRGTDGWTTYGHSSSAVAWDKNRWYSIERKIFSPIGFPNDFRADCSETASTAAGVLLIAFHGRTPTHDEVAAGDLSAFESIVGDLDVRFYEGSEVSDHRHEWNPRITLVTGQEFDGSASTRNVLEEFRSGVTSSPKAVHVIDRICWQLVNSTHVSAGVRSITICPELGFAPVEIRTVRGSHDLHWSGIRVSDIELDGRRMSSAESVIRLEIVEPKWSAFTVRTYTQSTWDNGQISGRGVISRYSEVTRPSNETSFQLETFIENGNPVVLMDNQQLKAEWRSGKVTRIYDGEVVKELASLEMKPARFSAGRVFAFFAVATAAAVLGWRTWKGRRKQPQQVHGQSRR